MADTLPEETIHQGEAKDLVVTVVDDDDQPVDLSSATLHYRVSRAPGATALLSIDQPAITVSGGSNNVVTVPRTRSQIKALPTEVLYHELYRKDADTVLAKSSTLIIAASQLAAHE